MDGFIEGYNDYQKNFGNRRTNPSKEQLEQINIERKKEVEEGLIWFIQMVKRVSKQEGLTLEQTMALLTYSTASLPNSVIGGKIFV